MKKIILFFLLLAVKFFSYSQTYPLRDRLDQVFANIDKNQITTGFLEEYGVALARLAPYNGVLSDSNKLDIGTWRKVYATLYTARINGINPLATLSSVNTTIENIENNFASMLPIPLLCANYNTIRTNAISANLLLAQNNQLYDVAERTQSPYLTKTLFAAAPTIGYASTGSPAVLFKPELFYNTTGKTLSNINIDFGDGRGYLNALWNTPVYAAYTTIGIKPVKIKVIFSDNSFVECGSAIEVTELGAAAARYSSPADDAQFFNATANHTGGTAFIKYSSTNTARKIKKPLIVAEGYDISSIAPKLQSNYSFENFIVDLERTRPSYDINNQLDLAGYDLIFLDYNNGSDDIRRNASLLQEVIVWVNGQKLIANSAEQNVVLGISMGGLVARYALASMTKQGIATQTRQLITHDSPHRGANTPLGLQALTRGLFEVALVQGLNIYDLVPELRQANSVLNAPATGQLLILRAGFFGSTSANTFLDGEYRTMITFAANGPQPTYQIKATSLGSECGIGSLTPSTELLRISGNFFVSPLFFISRTSWNTEVIVNALPAFGSSQRVMKLRLWINYRLLFFISFDLDLTNKEAYSPANTLPWDGVPGGTQSVSSQAGSRVPSVNYSLGPFFNLSFGATYAGAFCFVPTVSALDVTILDQPALSKVYTGGISPTNPARVNNFIAQERIGGSNFYNQTHPRLTPRNAQWIFNELQNISSPINCSSSCSVDYGFTITGSSQVCNSSSFTVTNNIYALPITWTSSNPSGFPINSTAAVATRVNNFNGQVTISATINGSCGSVVLAYPVIVGKGTPENQFTILGSNYCSSLTLMFNGYVGIVPGATNYQWFVKTGSGSYLATPFNGPTQYSIDRAISRTQPQYFKVIVTTPCGNLEAEDGPYQAFVGDCSKTNRLTLTTYPNPATSSLTIELIDSLAQDKRDPKLDWPFQVVILDRFSKKVYTGEFLEQKIQVPTENLAPDIYYLNVIYKDAILRKQIVIKK